MNLNFQSGMTTLKTLPAQFTEKLAAMGPFRRKAFEGVVLFAMLWVIYSIYLRALLEDPRCPVITINLALMLVFLKFCCFTGWPFTLIAFLDPTWRSKDAGNVFLAAYISTNVFWIHKYGHGFCPYSFAFQLFPYILGAVIGHKIGSWHHPARVDE